MSLSNGSYVMVCGASATLAVDSQGATTTNGANVRLLTRRASAGQLVTVQTYGSHRVIRMTLTGMVLDVKGGVAKAGANVQQYTWNKGLNQQWDLVQDGTLVVDGDTYDTYRVRSASNNAYEMGVVGTVAAKANIALESQAASSDHRWAFVPTRLLDPGVAYRLVSAASSSVCIGLSGKKGDTQVQLVGVADSNDQRWLAQDMGTPYLKFESLSTKARFLTPKGLAASASNPVVISTSSNDTSQQWRAVIVGSKGYNGQQVPVVELFNRETPTQALDAKGASTEIGTALQTYTSSGASSQRWLAIPETALLDTLAAPSQLGAAYSKGGKRVSNLWGNGRTELVPVFSGSSNSWELRYRTRSRKATAGDTTYTSWSPWKTPTGSDAWQGWGTGAAPTCKTSNLADPNGTERRYGPSIPLSVTTTGNDLVQWQYQVRRWGTSSSYAVPVHGHQANCSGSLKWRPSITVSAYTWNPEGLHILYESDQHRDGNMLTIYEVTETRGGHTYVLFRRDAGLPIAGLIWDGVATLPQSRLRRIPQENSTVTMAYRWENVDGAYMASKAVDSGTLTYGSGKGTLLDPDIEEPSPANGWMLRVRATDSHGDLIAADRYCAFVDYGGEFERYDDPTGEWAIPVRFGVPYTLHVMVQAGSSWDNDSSVHPAVAAPGLVLNTTGGCFVVRVNLGGIPERVHSTQAEWEAEGTNAGGFERVGVGESVSAPGTVQGVWRPTDAYPWTSPDEGEAMVGQFAWLREYDDRRRRVRVVGFDRTKKDRGNEQYVLSYRQVDDPMEV